MLQARLEAMQDAAIQKAWVAKGRAEAMLAAARLPTRMEEVYLSTSTQTGTLCSAFTLRFVL